MLNNSHDLNSKFLQTFLGKMTQRSQKFNQCYHRGVMTSYSIQSEPTDRLYVEQYRLIQELYGGTGVAGVMDFVGVRDDVEVRGPISFDKK